MQTFQTYITHPLPTHTHTQVGVRHALTLAAEQQLPWVPVHHMEAHALVAGMPGVLQQQQQQNQQQQQQQKQQQLPGQMVFPALLLLVSGGHNMLVSRIGFLGQVLGLWFGHHHPKNNCNIVTHFL